MNRSRFKFRFLIAMNPQREQGGKWYAYGVFLQKTNLMPTTDCGQLWIHNQTQTAKRKWLRRLTESGPLFESGKN